MTHKTKHDGEICQVGISRTWRQRNKTHSTGTFFTISEFRCQCEFCHFTSAKSNLQILSKSDKTKVSWFKSGQPAFLHCFYAQIPASRFVNGQLDKSSMCFFCPGVQTLDDFSLSKGEFLSSNSGVTKDP